LVIITEGLVNYFELGTISAVWQRLAHLLNGYPLGVYLTDVYPEVERPSLCRHDQSLQPLVKNCLTQPIHAAL
jgi:O-methyltransferase involved in polyketide biosynthesis